MSDFNADAVWRRLHEMEKGGAFWHDEFVILLDGVKFKNLQTELYEQAKENSK